MIPRSYSIHSHRLSRVSHPQVYFYVSRWYSSITGLQKSTQKSTSNEHVAKTSSLGLVAPEKKSPRDKSSRQSLPISKPFATSPKLASSLSKVPRRIQGYIEDNAVFSTKELRKALKEWSLLGSSCDYECISYIWNLYLAASGASKPGFKDHLSKDIISDMIKFIDKTSFYRQIMLSTQIAKERQRLLEMNLKHKPDISVEVAVERTRFLEMVDKVKQDSERLCIPLQRLDHINFLSIYSRSARTDIAVEHHAACQATEGKRDKLFEQKMDLKILRGYITEMDAYKSFEWYQKVQSQGIQIDKSIYRRLMMVITGKNLRAEALEVKQNMISADMKLTASIYNALLKMAVRIDNFELVIACHAEMIKEGINMASSSYGMLFRSYSENKQIDRAIQIYKQFMNSPVPMEERHVTVFVNGLLGLKKEVEATQLFKKFQEVRGNPGPQTYTTFIFYYCRQRNIEMLENWLRIMDLSGKPRSRHVYSLIIHGLCTGRQKPMLDKAIEYYDMMQSCVLDVCEGLSTKLPDAPDAIIRNNLLSFFGQMEQPDHHFSECMSIINISANLKSSPARSILISNVIDQVGHYGTIEQVRQVRQRIWELEIEHTPNSLNSLAEALLRKGATDEALAFFWDEMLPSNKINLKSLITYLSKLLDLHRAEDSKRILEVVAEKFPLVALEFRRWFVKNENSSLQKLYFLNFRKFFK